MFVSDRVSLQETYAFPVAWLFASRMTVFNDHTAAEAELSRNDNRECLG